MILADNIRSRQYYLMVAHSRFACPPFQPARNCDVQAAADHLSDTLQNYSSRDWEQAQREDHRFDAARRYLQLGCLKSPRPRVLRPPFLASTGLHANILDLATKGRLFQDDGVTILYLPVSLSQLPLLMIPLPAKAGSPLKTPSVSMCPTWPNRGSCLHATLMPPVFSVSIKYLNASTFVGVESLHEMVGGLLPQMPGA